MKQELAGSGFINAVNAKGFQLVIDYNLVNRWYYYSGYPAWYNNYPAKFPEIDDRVAIVAQFNEKGQCWYLKNYAFVNTEQVAVEEYEQPPGEGFMVQGQNSEISGNFEEAEKPVLNEISQGEILEQTSVNVTALAFACDVAPIIFGSGGATANKIIGVAEKFREFLET